MRLPAQVPTVILSLAAAGVLAACAGQPPPPPIGAEAGGALADQAEALAGALDDGRPCEADAMARELLTQAEDRFAAGELSEPALAALDASVAAIRAELTCRPDDGNDENKNEDEDQNKDDDKKDDEGKDDEKKKDEDKDKDEDNNGRGHGDD